MSGKKKRNGYIGNLDYLTNGSHGTVKTKTRDDGSEHITVYDSKRNCRVSYDRDKEGRVSNIHTTNQNTGKHHNYGSPKE